MENKKNKLELKDFDKPIEEYTKTQKGIVILSIIIIFLMYLLPIFTLVAGIAMIIANQLLNGTIVLVLTLIIFLFNKKYGWLKFKHINDVNEDDFE